jgi:hypothetical protein
LKLGRAKTNAHRQLSRIRLTAQTLCDSDHLTASQSRGESVRATRGPPTARRIHAIDCIWLL